MAEATLFVLVQIPFGVDVDSVDNDADMQMISGHIAGSADFGNGVVFVHRIANLSQKLAAMGVKGAIPAAVVDDEIISITDMVAGLYDRTGFHCQNWCAIGIHPWLTMTGFADIMAIAEMTPGPIAVNAATFVGIQVAGLPGALIATIGCIFPSCVIVMTLAYVYYRFRGLSVMQGILAGLRPAVIAMIASAGISLLCMALYGQRTFPADLGSMDLIALAVFLVGFFILRKWKPSPIKVMAGAAMAGVVLYSIAA